MGYAIGVDIGGTNIKAGIIEDSGKIIAKSSIPTLSKRAPEEILGDLGVQIEELLVKNNLTQDDIEGVGIGCPGSIDSENGVIDYSNNLDWHGVQLRNILAKTIKGKIMVSNDANVAALGETLFGAGKNYANTVLITLGTGVGGGIVIYNKLFEGYKSKGAEIGHIVIEVNGEQCTCGRKGCWEAYSSATALIRDTIRAMENDKFSAMWAYSDNDLNKVSGKTAFECAKKGDKSAQAVVDKYILYLAEGIVNITNLLRPEAIMLGGGVCAQGDYLLKPIIDYMKKNQYGGKITPTPAMLIASLGNDAGIVGGACLIFSKVSEEKEELI